MIQISPFSRQPLQQGPVTHLYTVCVSHQLTASQLRMHRQRSAHALSWNSFRGRAMVSFLSRGSWKNTAGERRPAISSAGGGESGGGGGQDEPECRRSGLPIRSLGLVMTFSRALSTQIQESHAACVACSALAPRLPLQAQAHTLSCSHRARLQALRRPPGLVAPGDHLCYPWTDHTFSRETQTPCKTQNPTTVLCSFLIP